MGTRGGAVARDFEVAILEVFAAEVFSSPLKDEKAFEAVRKLKPKPVSDL